MMASLRFTVELNLLCGQMGTCKSRRVHPRVWRGVQEIKNAKLTNQSCNQSSEQSELQRGHQELESRKNG